MCVSKVNAYDAYATTMDSLFLLLLSGLSASSVLVILDQRESTLTHSLTHLRSQFNNVEVVQASSAPSLFSTWDVRQYEDILRSYL